MNMLTLNGKLINVYTAPLRKAAEPGETEKDKLQIVGGVMQTNGQVRMDMVNITVPDGRKYQDQIGKEISLGVGVFAPAKGQILYFIPK